MVLFAICCRTCFGLSAASIQFAVLWLQILWLSIPRGTVSYTFTVDSAALFFIQAWVFLLVSGRWRWLLPACAFIGTLFKETILLLVVLSSLALLGVWLAPRLKRSLPKDIVVLPSGTFVAIAVALVAAGVAKWVASSVLPHAQPIHGSEWETMWRWLLRRMQDPLEVLRYLTAAFSAYGGFALLAVAHPRKPWLSTNRWTSNFAATLCVLYLAVCFVAGSDLTKFAFMAFPFALPILLVRFDEGSQGLALLALLLGLPAAHPFTPIQSPLAGHEFPSQDLQGTYSWMMEYAHPAIVGSWTAWWLACILLLRSVRHRPWQSAEAAYADGRARR